MKPRQDKLKLHYNNRNAKKLLMVLITHLTCVKCLVKNIFSLLLLYFIRTHITKKTHQAQSWIVHEF